ncbi:MAG TPA: hypothetical protein PLH94_03305 [Fimbriimonadaceae bacterium]|nr:hypothetical protein [Fimbriimonadaceae bacterium]
MGVSIQSIAGFCRLGLLAAASVATGAWAAGVTLEATPLWERMVPGPTPYPMRVNVTNSGPDTRGILRVRTLDWETSYPIELPNGSKKTWVIYPCNVSAIGEITFEMQTEFQRFRETKNVEQSVDGGTSVGMIADAPGLASFLRRDPPGGESNPRPEAMMIGEGAIRDVYVRPDLAPDRPVGYGGLGTLILGEGSERLTDAQIAAIRTWSLIGGDLVFVGGASSPVLADPRWRDLLPLKPSGVQVVPGASFGIQSDVTVTQGTLSPLSRADNASGFVKSAWRPHGLGRVVLLTFNPFEKPIEASPKRRDLVLNVLRQEPRVSPSNLIAQAVGMGDYLETTVIRSGRPLTAQASEERDPFDAQLPPTTKVFWILAAYFVLVVPVNLIVLRLLKRGEWAWISTPLISVAFASFFFTSAGDLYQAKLSVATRGLFVAQEGDRTGYVLAKSQVFFPRGGSYDLGFQGVDQVRSVQETTRFRNPFDRSELFEEMKPIDIGQVKAPAMSVPNLAFREFTFREIVPLGVPSSPDPGAGGWFQSTGKVSADGLSLVGKLVNRSPYSLDQGMISLGSGRVVVLSKSILGPGESVDFSVPLNPTSVPITDEVWIQLAPYDDRVLLVGMLSGFRAGPQLGRLVDDRSPMWLVYGLNLKRPEDQP